MASASNSFWGGFLFLFLFSRESYKFTNHKSCFINTQFNDITPDNTVETSYAPKTEITNINKLQLYHLLNLVQPIHKPFKPTILQDNVSNSQELKVSKTFKGIQSMSIRKRPP